MVARWLRRWPGPRPGWRSRCRCTVCSVRVRSLMLSLSPRAGASKVGPGRMAAPGRLPGGVGARLVSQPSAPPTCRSHQPVAHQEAASEDPQGAAKGGLHWGLAPCPCGLLHRPGWAEGLPPPYGAQQEGEGGNTVARLQSVGCRTQTQPGSFFGAFALKCRPPPSAWF